MAGTTAVGKSNYVVNHHSNSGVSATDLLFGLNTRRRIRDFTDGTSNTILVGERTSKDDPTNTPKTDRVAGIWIGVRLLTSTTEIPGSFADISSDTIANPALGADGINGASPLGFSSVHVGGAQFVFGDGRVRFLSENIDQTTFDALGSYAGDEVPGQY